MVVVEVLLGCNLFLFAACAIRGHRPPRSKLDELLASVRVPVRAGDATSVESDPDQDGATIIAFPTSEEMAIRRARAAHPSGHALDGSYACARHPSMGHPSLGHPSLGHPSLGHS